jgi:hypothetical protein
VIGGLGFVPSLYNFQGQIDEVKIWNYALTSDEVKEDYESYPQELKGYISVATLKDDYSIGEQIELTDPPQNSESGKLVNISYTHESINLNYLFKEKPIITKITINGSAYDKVIINNLENFGEIKEPVLPFKQVKLILPQDASSIKVEIRTQDEEIIPGEYLVEPGQPPIPLCEGCLIGSTFAEPSPEIYSLNKPYIKTKEIDKVLGDFSGYKIIMFNIHPVDYLPAQRKLLFYPKINIKVSYDLPGILQEASSFLVREEGFFRNLAADKQNVQSFVDNPELADSYIAKTSVSIGVQNLFEEEKIGNQQGEYDYLIITNNALKNSNGEYTFQDLMQSKEEKGIKTTIITTEQIYQDYQGKDNQEKIREFIKDAYNNWNIKYVLLGGDVSIIPCRKIHVEVGSYIAEAPSDVYYSNLDGNFNSDEDEYYGEVEGNGEIIDEADLFSEVFIGRAPVENINELSNFIRKTLEHEQLQKEYDSYLSKALFNGVVLWNSYNTKYGRVCDAGLKFEHLQSGDYDGNEMIPAGFEITKLYECGSGCSFPPCIISKTTFINEINKNKHIIVHAGHGLMTGFDVGSPFYVGDALLLDNSKPFFINSMACLSGDFEYNDCLAESFVISSNGAFAAILNSRYGWGSVCMNCIGSSLKHIKIFYDKVFDENYKIAKANQYAKQGMSSIGRYNSHRWVYFVTNLLGDPEASLQIPEKPQSKIVNENYKDISENLLIKIQKKRNNKWEDYQEVYNEEINIPADSLIKLDTIFNSLDISIDEKGEYKILILFGQKKAEWNFNII